MRKLLDWIADKLGYQRKYIYPTPFEFETESISGIDVEASDYLKIDTLPNECADFWGYELFGPSTSDEPDIPPPLIMDWS